MEWKKKSDQYVYDSESGLEYEDTGFEPPKHYEKLPIPATDVSVEDKEVWLIKTPKGFPISKLKKLPVSFTSYKVSNNGVPKFEVEGLHFQVNEDHFSSETAKYNILRKNLMNRRFDRFYTIREVVELPEIDFDTVVKPREDVKKIEGLRMRHFPTGYSEKDYDGITLLESRIDADGKVIKKAKTSGSESTDVDKEKEKKKEKKEKKQNKEKKEKKEKKKEKKEKKKEKEPKH